MPSSLSKDREQFLVFLGAFDIMISKFPRVAIMPKDVLVRDIDDDTLLWLKDTIPDGVSQNEFLRDIIVKAHNSQPQLSLFGKADTPRIIQNSLPFKFIDLFAGIGGFRCGMTAVGGNCVYTNEWDKYAAKTYQSWYGDDHIHCGDIGTVDISNDIPDHDVLCAGFPCQPFSLAGVSKKNSLGRAHGFDDEHQGNLFFKIMDIVDKKRPPVLFLENVKNLRSHDKGNTWKVIENSIIDRDYLIYSKIIDACHWVPQHRERIFIVCFDRKVFGRENQVQFQFPEQPTAPNPKLNSILEKNAPEEKYMLSDKLWQYLQDYAKKHQEKGNGFGFGLNTANDVARTMSARYHKDGSEILIKQKGWRNPRRLTPHEAMKLLGYCEKYSKLFGHQNGFPQVVSDTQAYRQFGNSVVPLVVEEIGKEIVKVMGDVIRAESGSCLLKRNTIAA